MAALPEENPSATLGEVESRLRDIDITRVDLTDFEPWEENDTYLHIAEKLLSAAEHELGTYE